MAFRSGKGQATLIGRGTAGSTGQPLIQDLPGGGQFGIVVGNGSMMNAVSGSSASVAPMPVTFTMTRQISKGLSIA